MTISPPVIDGRAVGSKTLVEADLADKVSIQLALKHHKVEAVIHFAAHAYVGESVPHPRKYFRNNAVNTLNLLDVMLDLGVTVPYGAAARCPEDPAVLVAHNHAAMELLGWKPQGSSLNEIVESAWLWHAKSPKLRSTSKV